jgi:uncharacterized membrane protein
VAEGLVDPVDADVSCSSYRRPMNSRTLLVTARSGLVVLMVSSLGFVLAPQGASPGYLLAAFKVVALLFLFNRIRNGDVYTMQWSSMFILLFVAEGTVRAMSDPQPSATIGAVEASAAAVYFVAVLGHLRPLKKLARRQKPR